MKITETAIPEVRIIEPVVFGDDRGFFFESFHLKAFRQAIGKPVEFVQDNHSRSVRHVLRGLHYQLPPFAQAKLVRVVQGKVFDVVVDIRRKSPTFGKWTGTILSADNKRQLWIPEGFAHGYITLSDTAECLYKTTNYYVPDSERCIIWNDPDLSIDWKNITTPLLSARDALGTPFREAEYFC
jgi:dTDP-4-dehydrorhamnose 3,5-epimerase